MSTIGTPIIVHEPTDLFLDSEFRHGEETIICEDFDWEEFLEDDDDDDDLDDDDFFEDDDFDFFDEDEDEDEDDEYDWE